MSTLPADWQLPAGWTMRPLGDVATLQRGFDLPVQDRQEGTVPIFAANGPVGMHDTPKVAGPGVVTGRSGSLGKVHFVQGDFWPLNTALWVKDFHGNDPKWVSRLLTWMRLEQHTRGVGVPTLNRNLVHEVEIPLPPLEEQRRIAAILDQADALRRLRRRALDRLNTLGQAIFHEMFGDPIENALGWERTNIGEVFSLKHGFAFKSENFVTEGSYILLTPGNFFEEGGFRHRGDKQKYHNDPVPAEFVLEPGDILIAMTEQAPGLLGSPIIVPEFGKFLHNQRLGKVIKKRPVESEFIVGLMNASSIRKRIQRDSTGLKVKHTSPAKIADIEIGLPPYDAQTQYADALTTVNGTTRRYLEGLQKKESLFASLRHRAFGGEL